MKLKTLLRNFPVFVAAAILALVFIIITFFKSVWLAVAELVYNEEHVADIHVDTTLQVFVEIDVAAE